jgi:branched-chain amino acid transport system permease protein
MINLILLLVIYFGIFSILALGQNLITGFTGLLSLGHAAFFAIGAYASAIALKGGMNFLPAMIIAVLLSGLFGVLIGLPTIRLKGDYLAIATLGFAEIVRNVIINWDSLTRGPMGISSIPAPVFFGIVLSSSNKILYAILVWVAVFLIYLLLRHLTRSRMGLALDAIREDEIAAQAMGIPVVSYKIGAFAFGAMIAGFAGFFWSVFNQTITPDNFTFMLSVMILSMVVLGGLGNHLGAITGAVIIQLISELPRLLGLTRIISPEIKQIVFGLILILMMIYRPQGIWVRKRVHFSAAYPGNRLGLKK